MTSELAELRRAAWAAREADGQLLDAKKEVKGLADALEETRQTMRNAKEDAETQLRRWQRWRVL